MERLGLKRVGGQRGECFNEETPEKSLGSVPDVDNGGEEHYMLRRGGLWGVGRNLNDDNTLKWSEKCS